jgi:hypothetical protein
MRLCTTCPLHQPLATYPRAGLPHYLRRFLAIFQQHGLTCCVRRDLPVLPDCRALRALRAPAALPSTAHRDNRVRRAQAVCPVPREVQARPEPPVSRDPAGVQPTHTATTGTTTMESILKRGVRQASSLRSSSCNHGCRKHRARSVFSSAGKWSIKKPLSVGKQNVFFGKRCREIGTFRCGIRGSRCCFPGQMRVPGQMRIMQRAWTWVQALRAS